VKTYDVAVIGGGVIGASIAFELAGRKLRVLVLDRQQPGQEASWAAAGMLSPAPDSPRDIPLVPLGCESLRSYPEFANAIEESSGRSIGLEAEGALELFSGPDAEGARDHRVSECKQLGIAVEAVPIEKARTWENGVGSNIRAAAWLPEEGRVEPRLLTEAVLLAAHNRGVEFRLNCPVTDFFVEHQRCMGVVAAGEKVTAEHVILAAGSFSNQIGGNMYSSAQYAPTRPVRGQAIALRPDGLRLKCVLRTGRGYLVPRRDGQIVAGSTCEDAGFDKRVTPEGLRSILDNALEIAPALRSAAIVDTWSGLRPGTPDDLPILGPTDIRGLLIATGHYRNGILLSAITAKLMREWVTVGGTSFDAASFSPLRFTKAKSQALHAPS
jgi:glycine oxidase